MTLHLPVPQLADPKEDHWQALSKMRSTNGNRKLAEAVSASQPPILSISITINPPFVANELIYPTDDEKDDDDDW
jgi:hypothetical protein